MSNRGSIRVMLVDDNVAVRNGLKLFLNSFDHLEFAGQATNGKEAIRLCAKFQPDVILMDYVMPEMDGVTATEAIRHQNPHIQVIILTFTQDSALMKAAKQAGAATCLQKAASIHELEAAIRQAYAQGALN